MRINYLTPETSVSLINYSLPPEGSWVVGIVVVVNSPVANDRKNL